MSRSEFKKGDTVRMRKERRGLADLLDVDLEVIAVYGPSHCLDVRAPDGRMHQFLRAERFELVERPPTINPDEWTPVNARRAQDAEHDGAMYVLFLWALTNLAPVLLAGWAHRDPEPTVMVELPREVAEFAAEYWDEWHIAERCQIVARACKAALEQENPNG